MLFAAGAFTPLAAARASSPGALTSGSAPAASQVAGDDGNAKFRRLLAHWKSHRRPDSVLSFRASSIRPSVERRQLTSRFGMRRHPIAGGARFHAGIDLAEVAGRPIYATAGGTVTTAQWVGGYGLLVTLKHGRDLETRYGHLSRVRVAVGQLVQRGEVLGFVGSTGRATGPHLHYEVRVDGEPVDPIPYISAARRSLSSAGGNSKGSSSRAIAR